MAWPASLPGRLLEAVGNGGPRGMVVHDRTRLIDRLPTFPLFQYHRQRSLPPFPCLFVRAGLPLPVFPRLALGGNAGLAHFPEKSL